MTVQHLAKTFLNFTCISNFDDNTIFFWKINIIHAIFLYQICFCTSERNMLISLYLGQYKYVKMSFKKKISVGHYASENFLCFPRQNVKRSVFSESVCKIFVF